MFEKKGRQKQKGNISIFKYRALKTGYTNMENEKPL